MKLSGRLAEKMAREPETRVMVARDQDLERARSTRERPGHQLRIALEIERLHGVGVPAGAARPVHWSALRASGLTMQHWTVFRSGCMKDLRATLR